MIDYAKLRTTLTELGPLEHFSWDKESNYFQIYGDEGTIATTHDPDIAAAITDSLRIASALTRA